MNAKGSRQLVSHGRAGFTLIELMVAMVILSVGLFAIIHLMVVSTRGSSYAREMTEAHRIAAAVADELRTRALAWDDNTPFTTVFPEIAVAPPPDVGDSIAADLLSSLERFQNKDVAAGNLVADSYLINLWGARPALDAAVESLGAVYRVHYTAHWVRLRPGDPPSNGLVRLVLIVSWDNKDHGEQNYDWGTWHAPAAFCKRHMAALTTFLRRTTRN